jgi:hypothetical protein
MWKFLLISLVIWFFVKRLMRFNFVMYRGGDFRSPLNYSQTRKPEGSITVESTYKTTSSDKNDKDGDYVDYEEVK